MQDAALRTEEEIEFVDLVKKESGVDVNVCMQCGACVGGCVQEWTMDYNSRRITGFILNDQKKEALSSKAIWVCAGCHTCTVRCPRGVDLAKVMDALRIMSKREGLVHKEAKGIPLFNDIFLKLIKTFGRMYEPGLLMGHNLLSGNLLKDMEKGPSMFLKGKLSLLPTKIKGLDEIKEIFRKVEEMEG